MEVILRKSSWDGREMVVLLFGDILYQDLLHQGGRQHSKITLQILAPSAHALYNLLSLTVGRACE